MYILSAEMNETVVNGNTTDTNSGSYYTNTSYSGSGSGSGSGSASDESSGIFSDIDDDLAPNEGDGTLSSSDRNTTGAPPTNYDSERYQYTNISIYLPPNVFNQLNSTDVGLLYSFYDTPMLFPLRVDTENNYPEIASPVIGVSLAQAEPVVNLTEDIVMVVPYKVVSSTDTTHVYSKTFFHLLIMLSTECFSQSYYGLCFMGLFRSW